MNTDSDYCGAECSCSEPEDCPYHTQLDGRNGGPTNQFDCPYVDCDCTEPCSNKVSGDNIGFASNDDMHTRIENRAEEFASSKDKALEGTTTIIINGAVTFNGHVSITVA